MSDPKAVDAALKCWKPDKDGGLVFDAEAFAELMGDEVANADRIKKKVLAKERKEKRTEIKVLADILKEKNEGAIEWDF